MLKHLLPVAVMLCAAPAVAQYVGPAGAPEGVSPGYPLTTVAEIKADPRDDANVTLEGFLIRQIDRETYVFRDDTGEIEVEIDEDDFPRQPVSETTRVRIEGEVDTHRLRDTDIDADRVMILE